MASLLFLQNNKYAVFYEGGTVNYLHISICLLHLYEYIYYFGMNFYDSLN